MRKSHWITSAALTLLATTTLDLRGDNRSPASDRGPERLDVGEGWYDGGGHITSRLKSADGKGALHGLQVLVGPKHKLIETAVFHEGKLKYRTQYYPSGLKFRHQQRDENGNGLEFIYEDKKIEIAFEDAKTADGKPLTYLTQQPLLTGRVQADQPWDGEVLRWELIRNGFGSRLMKQTFKNGQLTGSTPFDEETLSLPPDPSKHTGPAAWPWRWKHHAAEWPNFGSGR